MQITHIVTSSDVEKLKQIARKLKKSEGITHNEALDRAAQRVGLTLWHHVIENAKKIEPTETAYRSGVIIAMDVKEAGDFHDDEGNFVEDNYADIFCEKDLYLDLCESPYDEEDEVDGSDYTRMREMYTEGELMEINREDLSNYTFFRFTRSAVPESVQSVVAMTDKCSMWQPRLVWYKGRFHTPGMWR